MGDNDVDFVTIRRRRQNDSKRDVDPYGHLKARFEKFFSIVAKDPFFKLIAHTVVENSTKLTHIRCLALGNLATDSSAFFQLCLLKYLQDYLIGDIDVSVYDPVFDDLDVQFLQDYLHYKVEKEYSLDNHLVDQVLFFMPHALYSTIEDIVREVKPLNLLTNNVVKYSYNHSDAENLRKIPNCATIAHLVTTDQGFKASVGDSDGGFKVVTRRKPGKRMSSKAFIPPTLDYHLESRYFSSVYSKVFSDPSSNIWNNAFSDLAFIRLFKRQ
ncbi:hypothetical protein FOA43_003993 [Brettanomyces nanus]|uniref:SRR1-like domain-containing protein n=1 Tax=Eeniella nana TaxID=13502 RepID=A0A875S4N5_EENNA|nr:uncharacterized protein FOA43_003993 [Brettanomyces nanus]QPG76601.1 hypothetical protein FOA43_003993 [Brettanomyces nanus]